MICYIAKIYKTGWNCTTNQSLKGKRKTKTVNQDVVKEKGLIYILHYMWYITDVDRGSI